MSSKVPLRVLLIVASTRPGRLGPAIADWFVQATLPVAADGGVTLDVADLAEIGLPLLDEPEHPAAGVYVHEHSRAWSRRVAAADAFVVVTPEYNYGMPAALKNAFDFLYHEWAWKPVAFVSYGNTSAGTRSVQMAKQVVTTLKMMPIGATVALRIADSVDNGQVVTSAVLDEAARGVLRELTRVAHAMRPLRTETLGDDTGVPGPVEGLRLTTARPDDLAELLVLQRCCWVQEAFANDTLDLPPLRETLDDLRASMSSWQLWCVRRDGRLVAAVRARAHGRAWQIGRLMVGARPGRKRHRLLAARIRRRAGPRADHALRALHRPPQRPQHQAVRTRRLHPHRRRPYPGRHCPSRQAAAAGRLKSAGPAGNQRARRHQPA